MKPSSESEDSPERLDQIVTQWSLLRLAHHTIDPQSPQARQAMTLKYRDAIRNYVMALLSGQPAADDLAQDVLLRLMRGDFASADPSRGRFRDFLKIAVKNMVRTHWAQQNRRSAASLQQTPGLDPEEEEDESLWTEQWRSQLLQETWVRLEEYQTQTPGCCYFTLLKLRAENPSSDSTQLAELLSQATHKQRSSEVVRQQLRRSRLRFAQLLVEELASSLRVASPDDVEAELATLGLLDYVRPFLPPDWKETGELREL